MKLENTSEASVEYWISEHQPFLLGWKPKSRQYLQNCTRFEDTLRLKPMDSWGRPRIRNTALFSASLLPRALDRGSCQSCLNPSSPLRTWTKWWQPPCTTSNQGLATISRTSLQSTFVTRGWTGGTTSPLDQTFFLLWQLTVSHSWRLSILHFEGQHQHPSCVWWAIMFKISCLNLVFRQGCITCEPSTTCYISCTVCTAPMGWNGMGFAMGMVSPTL